MSLRRPTSTCKHAMIGSMQQIAAQSKAMLISCWKLLSLSDPCDHGQCPMSCPETQVDLFIASFDISSSSSIKMYWSQAWACLRSHWLAAILDMPTYECCVHSANARGQVCQVGTPPMMLSMVAV